MLGLVVLGLRTWMCTIAAPALAASIDDCAICSGVTGTAGLRPGVSAEPVTAQEIITLRCMASPHSVQVDASAEAGGCVMDLPREVISAGLADVALAAAKTNDHERGARVHPAS